MKTIKIILIAVLFISAYSASAQWSTNGSNVYYNGGNVGIGTSTPSSVLNIYSPSTAYLNIESPYSGTGSPAYNISAINLKNTTTGDLLYIGLRKRQGAHDMVQSVYDASTSTWRGWGLPQTAACSSCTARPTPSRPGSMTSARAWFGLSPS